jgi:glycosyltransferase involved in cell wall biosynthesis
MLLNKIIYRKKIIVAPRGELQNNALNIKRTKKLLYLFIYKLLGFYKNIYFHSTDTIETISIQSLFYISNITQLQNAVKIYNFQPLSKKEKELRIIFISRISRKKNLHFALEILKNVKCNVLFDIYGPKEDEIYWSECFSMIKMINNNVTIRYRGTLQQHEVIEKMRGYHTFLFPTLSENFGHIIVEAMQAGLIPIISNQTPWNNLDDYNAGWDIPLNKPEVYVKVIEKLYSMNAEEYTNKSLAIMEYIHNRLDMEKLTNDYVKFFNKIGLESNKYV